MLLLQLEILTNLATEANISTILREFQVPCVASFSFMFLCFVLSLFLIELVM